MLPMAVKPEANLVVFGMLASTLVLGGVILSRVEQLRPLIEAPIKVSGASTIDSHFLGDLKSDLRTVRSWPMEQETARRDLARGSLRTITRASLVSVVVSGLGAVLSGWTLLRSRRAMGSMASSAPEPIQPTGLAPASNSIRHPVPRGSRTSGFDLDLGDDEDALDRQFLRKGLP